MGASVVRGMRSGNFSDDRYRHRKVSNEEVIRAVRRLYLRFVDFAANCASLPNILVC